MNSTMESVWNVFQVGCTFGANQRIIWVRNRRSGVRACECLMLNAWEVGSSCCVMNGKRACKYLCVFFSNPKNDQSFFHFSTTPGRLLCALRFASPCHHRLFPSSPPTIRNIFHWAPSVALWKGIVCVNCELTLCSLPRKARNFAYNSVASG